jgi:formate hydrogenlyase subunit 6/NADH:ubiquinone oxidoreductase subunit I
VEACPKDAIRMDTKIYEINAYTRQDMVHSKSYMINLMDGVKPAAIDVYREDPGSAPAGYTWDEERVV